MTSQTFRVLVCGSRTFNDYWLLFDKLCEIQEKHPDLIIIQGGARGADQMARKWASLNGVKGEQYNANWEVYGRAAGPIRNQQMLDTGIDLVVAFPRGEARGTKHMMKIAREAGVEVLEF